MQLRVRSQSRRESEGQDQDWRRRRGSRPALIILDRWEAGPGRFPRRSARYPLERMILKLRRIESHTSETRDSFIPWPYSTQVNNFRATIVGRTSVVPHMSQLRDWDVYRLDGSSSSHDEVVDSVLLDACPRGYVVCW